MAEVRNAFTRGGGSLGETGCVAWLFDQRGMLTIETDGSDPEDVELQAIDAGADDVRVDGEVVEVYTAPTELEAVRSALEASGAKIAAAELAMIPKTSVELSPKDAASNLRLMERLEDLDDVQKVSTNLEISEAALAEYAER